MKPPSPYSALPPIIYYQASPKAISRRTSYIQIRLEFLRYPQVITDYFNRRVFGPPQRFTAASTCSWLGHPVSGLRHYTLFALFRLAFASTSRLYRLISHNIVTRRPVLQKVRHHFLAVAVSACKHRVSGSLSLPSRGAFHLSLTVLYSIGHMVVFSLMRWSSHIPSGFLVSRRTPDTPPLINLSPTGLLPCFARLSSHLRLGLLRFPGVLYPVRIATYGLGSSDFARHYFRNRCFTFFSSG